MKPVVYRQDFWIWKFNRSGVFTVKSGYWIINNQNHAECIQAAEIRPSVNLMKEEIWNLQMNAKIKVFL